MLSAVALAMTPLLLGIGWLEVDFWIGENGVFPGELALLGLCLIVFVETGLLIGFFLPGDSLLFTGGLFVATGVIDTPLWIVAPLVGVAAFLGDQCGYLIGRASGPKIFNKPDSRLFKQEYVDTTHAYFEKYGGRTVVIARFVPIVRTFTPVVAGVGKMDYRAFVAYNFIGAVMWGIGLTLLGFWLGQFEFVQTYLEPIILVIIFISVLPIVFELLRARSRSRNPRFDEEHEREQVRRDAFSKDQSDD